MKNLKYYIKEELDTDNIFWKLSMWFRNHEDEREEFNKLIEMYKTKNLSWKELYNYLGEHEKELKIDSLVDFLDDSPIPQENKDNLYVMTKILDTIIANKSETF